MRWITVLVAALALVACGRKAETPSQTPVANAPDVREVAAADSFGVAGERVTDVAFWSHPAIAFESLLFAAAGGKLSAYSIETGETRFEIPGAAERVDIFYAGEGPGALGHLLATGDGIDRLYTIDQDGRGFKQVSIGIGGPLSGERCVAGGANPALYELTDGALTIRSIKIAGDNAQLSSMQRVAEIANGVACSVDPLTGEVFVTSADGAIRRVDPASGTVFGLAMPRDLNPASAALATGQNERGEPVGQVAALKAGGATVSLFDAKDGHAIGDFRIKATFDLEAVETAIRIEIGAANYGGVYRGGALAIVTEGGGAPVRLVPWNGVMGALSLPVAAVIDPRNPGGDPVEEDVISIDLIEP